MTTQHVADLCVQAFAFLTERYGFDAPETDSIGRETFVRFHRGDQTVSIAYEPGSAPIVELFTPAADTGEPPVPWAERNGVPRTRRIPPLDVRAPVGRPDEDALCLYLKASAEALERVEHDWLSASSP